MLLKHTKSLRLVIVATGFFVPMQALAAEETVFGITDAQLTLIGWIAVGALAGAVLSRLWLGIMNHTLLEHESLSSIEERHPTFTNVKTAVGTVVATAVLLILSLKVLGNVVPFSDLSNTQMLSLFGSIAISATTIQFVWKRSRDNVFAFVIGTAITFCLLGFKSALLDGSVKHDPFIMALGIVCVVILWRLLFGPWSPRIKATVLGTFLLWVGVHIIFREAPSDRFAYLIASAVALIPAVVWCWFFLEYHVQRKSLALLMFFAGMLSTAPILFYDLLVRRGVELQFFLFRIIPENFNVVTNAFVSGNITSVSGIRSTLLATFLSFMIVGFIEELSKFWVLKKSGQSFFTSIDDVIQLAVIGAIGFAFAENVLNPSYFLSFVHEFLVDSEQPQWWTFLGNVSGRAILTTMVHIVSSGVMGYFLGLAIFAKPYLEDSHCRGHGPLISGLLHRLLRFPEKRIFQIQVILVGLLLATALHGLFNFMVTFPDMLPGNPGTFGELFHLSEGNFLHYIPILILPSFLYIVGGFWLFTALFYRKENMKERGCLVPTDTFVTSGLVA